MPGASTQNDTSSRRQQRHGQGRQGEVQARSGRCAVALPLSPTGGASMLSPLLSSLPKLSGITGLLPVPSPPPASSRARTDVAPVAGAHTQWVNLEDGLGKRPILVQWTKATGIQILSLPFTPDLGSSHQPISSVSPVEIFCLPEIRLCPATGQTCLPGVSTSSVRSSADMTVLQAEVISSIPSQTKPILALLTCSKSERSPLGSLAFTLVSVENGQTIRELSLGMGNAGSFATSKRSLVIGVSKPHEAVYILDTETLRESHAPLLDVCADPRTSIPVFALSERMLAFTTSIPPIIESADGVGSIVTATSTRTAHAPIRQHDSLLSTAAEIGGGVARGVWAGLQLGAKAASSATSRLARSAPVEGGAVWRSISGSEHPMQPSVVPDSPDGHEEEDEILSGSPTPRVTPASPAGRWVVVLDLWPRRSCGRQGDSGVLLEPTTIAHFALPRNIIPFSPHKQAVGSPGSFGLARDPSYGLPSHQPQYTQAASPRHHPTSPSISFLSFSPDGLSLLVAPSSGRVLHNLEVRPSPGHAHQGHLDGSAWSRGYAAIPCGEVWERYQLRRGITGAAISSVQWGNTGGEGQWVGVGTHKGTIHIFPICRNGGHAGTSTHVRLAAENPTELQPLSVSVPAVARARVDVHLHNESNDDLALMGVEPQMEDRAPAFSFLSSTLTGNTGGSQHDLAVSRPTEGTVDLLRMQVRASKVPGPRQTTNARGSGLTEMMKDRGILGREGALVGELAVVGRWNTSLEGQSRPTCLQSSTETEQQTGQSAALTSYLAQAEIQTHSCSRRVLPASVYLNKQIEFYAAAPIDTFSPLSIMDDDARLERLVFRPDIEVRSTSSDVGSFDEPLSTALQTSLDAHPSPLIPGLPNGQPSRTAWRKAIPIRHVAAGLGEGVDRVRREIARAQHSRQRRRASEAAGNSLSFDEQAVFPSSVEGKVIDDGSSPGSMIMPHGAESSIGADERSDEWEEGWEEEYQRAVDEDGPDDLILGLLDEEEEDRRKWQQAQFQVKQSVPELVRPMPEKQSKARRRKERASPRSIENSPSVAVLGSSANSGKETHLRS